MHGVAAVTARGKVGFVDSGFFAHNGFHVVQSEGGIDLVVSKFDLAAADPHFLHDLRKKTKALGEELTVVSSPQCPYAYEGAKQIVELAHQNRIAARSLRVTTLAQLRHTSPSPYASFDIVYQGKVISNLFHCMTARGLRKLVSPGKPGRPTDSRPGEETLPFEISSRKQAMDAPEAAPRKR